MILANPEQLIDKLKRLIDKLGHLIDNPEQLIDKLKDLIDNPLLLLAFKQTVLLLCKQPFIHLNNN